MSAQNKTTVTREEKSFHPKELVGGDCHKAGWCQPRFMISEGRVEGWGHPWEDQAHAISVERHVFKGLRWVGTKCSWGADPRGLVNQGKHGQRTWNILEVTYLGGTLRSWDLGTVCNDWPLEALPRLCIHVSGHPGFIVANNLCKQSGRQKWEQGEPLEGEVVWMRAEDALDHWSNISTGN